MTMFAGCGCGCGLVVMPPTSRVVAGGGIGVVFEFGGVVASVCVVVCEADAGWLGVASLWSGGNTKVLIVWLLGVVVRLGRWWWEEGYNGCWSAV